MEEMRALLTEHLEKEEMFQRELLVTLERLQNRADRADEVHEALLEQIKTVNNLLHSTDTVRPGLSLRVDRIEQDRDRTRTMLKFLTGGSLLTTLAIIALLVKVTFL